MLEILKYKAPVDFKRDCTLGWNLAFLIHSGLMIRLRLISAPATRSLAPSACCCDPFQDCTGGAFIMQSEALWFIPRAAVVYLNDLKLVALHPEFFHLYGTLRSTDEKYYIKRRNYYGCGIMKLFVCNRLLVSHSMFMLPLYTSQQRFHSHQSLEQGGRD